MSPLARALLALAAAALLHSACASPRHTVGDTACTTVIIGSVSGDSVPLQPVEIPAGTKNALVDINNDCTSKMNGEIVTVCDDVAPVVKAGPWPRYTPVEVDRKGKSYDGAATVSVTQYCD